jgi:hypothetical protein
LHNHFQTAVGYKNSSKFIILKIIIRYGLDEVSEKLLNATDKRLRKKRNKEEEEWMKKRNDIIGLIRKIYANMEMPCFPLLLKNF